MSVHIAEAGKRGKLKELVILRGSIGIMVEGLGVGLRFWA